jgi:DNA-binding GntR family transcriptional regulator
VSRSEASNVIESVVTASQVAPTMSESVAARLRDLIIGGQLPAGTALRLAPLAHQLHVSVMPVREALRTLETEGLVVVTPRRGAVVSEPSVEEAEEIYTIRIGLEALCARYATQRLTDADIDDLRQAFEAMAVAAKAGDLREFVGRDHEFHLRLYRTAGRERLVRTIEDLISRSLRYIPYLHRAQEMDEDPLDAHRPLLVAIELRDSTTAEQLTRHHMERAMTRLLRAISHPSGERSAVQPPEE